MKESEKKPLLEPNGGNVRVIRPAHYLIVPVILVQTFGLGINSYISTEYVRAYFQSTIIGNNDTGNNNMTGCNSDTSNPLYQSYITVQQETSRWTMYFTVASGVPAVFSSIVLGTYADRLGRRLLLLSVAFGVLVKSGILTAVIYFDANLIYILIGSFIDGCAGGSFSFLAGTFSYVADITKAGKTRSFAIISVELVSSIAGTAASFGTGYFIAILGYFYSMILATSCICIAVLIVICGIPETCRNKLTARTTICNTLGKAIEFYVSKQYYGKRWKYAVLLISFCFVSLGGVGRASVETLYLLGAPLCWDSVKVGIFGSVKKGAESILGVLISPLLLKCMSSEMLTILGLVSTTASMVLEGLAKTETVFYIVPAIGVFGILAFPMIRSIMSVMTPHESQGSLFAGICAIETVCSMVSSIISKEMYIATVSMMSGFVFLSSAAQTTIAVVLVV
ncbi:hypothetical protein CHS0354_027672 [Potamilus streckersoni]|uniref:Major facilitator superfamily (MFS) profile domain-containing protein n=1 Tax=Potamilus streckersoni TaxID=2493646 RepID=A0AAE0W601_9BIVA|nr:hypothetical protein CHS0354_027672 [Potamilus streckersoni]